jgi:hypothetical protein
LKRGGSAISVDTGKKEGRGNCKNDGDEYRLKKRPRKVLDHDFPFKKPGEIIPYGLYSANQNTGFVNMGTSHDTGEFSVESISRRRNTGCKKSVLKHCSEQLDSPKDYAVDGVLYYAKFLKNDYNVIAVALSGTKKDNIKANAYYWQKGHDDYTELKKARDIIYEPENYLRFVSGEALKKAVSIAVSCVTGIYE